MKPCSAATAPLGVYRAFTPSQGGSLVPSAERVFPPESSRDPRRRAATTQSFQIGKLRMKNPSPQRELARSLTSTVLRHSAISAPSIKWIYGFTYLVLSKPVSRLKRTRGLGRMGAGEGAVIGDQTPDASPSPQPLSSQRRDPLSSHNESLASHIPRARWHHLNRPARGQMARSVITRKIIRSKDL